MGRYYLAEMRSGGGLKSKAHRLMHHSTLGWRVIKKKEGEGKVPQRVLAEAHEVPRDRIPA